MSHAGSGASNRSIAHRYDRCDPISPLQHTQPTRACRLSRDQMDLRRKMSRTLAFPLRCALIERSGQSFPSNEQQLCTMAQSKRTSIKRSGMNWSFVR